MESPWVVIVVAVVPSCRADFWLVSIGGQAARGLNGAFEAKTPHITETEAGARPKILGAKTNARPTGRFGSHMAGAHQLTAKILSCMLGMSLG